jgi:DNA-directed RNA polymerase specialized sigma24 family protein
MTGTQLSFFLDGLSEIEKLRWSKQQEATALLLIAGLVRLAGGFSGSIEFSDPKEIVNETTKRILERHSDRYVWDGMTPGTLNKFFARCMRTTLSSFRAEERGHRAGGQKLRQQPLLNPTPMQIFEQHERSVFAPSRANEVLAAALKSSRLRGKTRQYLKEIQRYASAQNSTAEIAADLNVQINSVDTFRKRARSLLKPPEGNSGAG